MIVEAFIADDGILYLGNKEKINDSFSTFFNISSFDLSKYEVKQESKSKLKQVLKLKEAGFNSDEILELLKEV